jgi:hypothetical protein
MALHKRDGDLLDDSAGDADGDGDGDADDRWSDAQKYASPDRTGALLLRWHAVRRRRDRRLLQI